MKLFNRVERKYKCTKNQLYLLLGLLKENYYLVTDIDDDDDFVFKYHSLYFDTPEMIMFNAHENSEQHRQKIRIREYSDGEKFLEIKDKDENGITRKSRIPVDSYVIDGEKQWIDKNLMYDTIVLNKTLDITYDRITLVSRDKTERITIDFNICFHNFINDISRTIDDVIIEVKQVNEYDSFIIEELNKLNIERVKFSKYHIGIKLTKEE
ncbi:MAG: VTC domain-containing protein [Clostridia bacterium]|nr:VTC domain-containing protein [Clostridia bacterium]